MDPLKGASFPTRWGVGRENWCLLCVFVYVLGGLVGLGGNVSREAALQHRRRPEFTTGSSGAEDGRKRAGRGYLSLENLQSLR